MGHDDDSKLALACLIPRLLDPRSGRVLIDGHDLRDVTFDSVRAQVATVLQADLVFTDSVLVNIGLGDPMNTLPRIIEAAKVAHAHHFIQDLPHGYDTMIGPLGHYLKPDEQFRDGAGSRLSARPLDPDRGRAQNSRSMRTPAFHRRHPVAAVDRAHADHHSPPLLHPAILRSRDRLAATAASRTRARRKSCRPRASCSAIWRTPSSTNSPTARSKRVSCSSTASPRGRLRARARTTVRKSHRRSA